MKKLTAMVCVLLMAGVLLSGCYSKNCDSSCPGTKASMNQ
jgi:hypothetical protein